ncbi:MAG: hypothetical protein ACW99L_11180 [Promethearchaeota archaeon]
MIPVLPEMRIISPMIPASPTLTSSNILAFGMFFAVTNEPAIRDTVPIVVSVKI